MKVGPRVGWSALILALGLAGAGLGVVAGALPATEEGYSTHDLRDWRNRPQEPFTSPRETFQKALEVLSSHGYGEDELYRAATAGMLEHLDPATEWDRLLTPAEYDELMTNLKGEIVGIGVELEFDAESGEANVLAVIPGSAAEASGIEVADRILSVDGRTFRGAQFEDMIFAIRGQPDTPVTLRFLRGDQLLEETLTRRAVDWDVVTGERLAGNVGLVTIKYFSEKTPEAIARVVADLRGVEDWIVDLRANGGGGLAAAVESSGHLLPEGALFATAIKKTGEREELRAGPGAGLPAGKVIVLVNGSTSSSAELTAQALRHTLGARLIGRTTRGKWNAQRVELLANGFALKFTTATFEAPDGRSYDGVGLTPDIDVEMNEDLLARSRRLESLEERMTKDRQLQAALSVIRHRR